MSLLKPAAPVTIRRRCQEYASRPEPQYFDRYEWYDILAKIERAIREAVTGEGALPVQDEKITGEVCKRYRRLLQGWLYTPDDQPLAPLSSKTFTAQQQNGIARWVLGNGTGRAEFAQELRWLLGRAIADSEFIQAVALDRPHPMTMSELLARFTAEPVQEYTAQTVQPVSQYEPGYEPSLDEFSDEPYNPEDEPEPVKPGRVVQAVLPGYGARYFDF